MKSHKKFMEEVAEASSLPAQTCRALAPESQEDYAVYTKDAEHENTGVKDGTQ